MKTVALLFTLIIYASGLFSQINMQDSSVQVIGYWDVKASQSYKITFNKYKIQDGDTLRRNALSYVVDVKIIDSTATSYTIEWYYKDFKVQGNNEMARKMATIAEDLSVLIKTDEFGAFQNIVNWEDVRDQMQKGSNMLKQEMKDVPMAGIIMDQMMAMYSTKESIEANAIKDVHQFYSFHGGKYVLGELVEGKVQRPNNFGGDAFDVDVSLSLDEINEKDDSFVLRMHQVTDSKQLSDATYAFMKKGSNAGASALERSAFPELTSESWTASQIHGSSGWLIYSVEAKVLNSDGMTNVEERIIGLQ